MQVSDTIFKRVKSMLNVFENDSGSPLTEYNKIYIYADGNNNRRQVTLSTGFTEDGGALGKVVSRYVSKAGKYSQALAGYLRRIGTGVLHSNSEFKRLLVTAGSEDQKFRDACDEIYREIYGQPAIDWATKYGFTQNLSFAVIQDSFLHSGGILDFLRSRFPASPPSRGGNEKEWVKQYVDARHAWLANHSNRILRNTVYRTQFFKRQIANENWSFDLPMTANGVKLPV